MCFCAFSAAASFSEIFIVVEVLHKEDSTQSRKSLRSPGERMVVSIMQKANSRPRVLELWRQTHWFLLSPNSAKGIKNCANWPPLAQVA